MGTHRRSGDRKRQEAARQLRQWSVSDFHDRLAAEGITRAWVVFENGEFTLSHRALAPLQSFLELSQDFGRHEGLFFGREEGFKTVFCAFVHDTRRGLSQGGLRFQAYADTAELVIDGLRLARGMTRKNALAGLHWGGGKGILAVTDDVASLRKRRSELTADEVDRRDELFKAYGRFVAGLGGVYYTAEDIGTSVEDLAAVLSQNRFTTCIPPAFGGSGNPSAHTARGVFRAIQAAWSFLEGSEDLRDVRVAVQGAGNVGAPLVRMLDDAGAKVFIADLDKTALAELKGERPAITIVDGADLLSLEVEIIAPCAIGGVINVSTIPDLRCRLICGAANNILGESTDAERLKARGITFVPDYLCNRMGIINCANEWFGYMEDDVRMAAERVHPDTQRVLRHAGNLSITTTESANELADAAATELHPLMGHRGRRLIDRLISRHRSGRPSDPQPLFDPTRDEGLIHGRQEKDGRFRGEGPAIAAAPLSTSGGAQLGAFLAPLLADVRCRALEILDRPRPRRVLGSDHGGLGLQLALEAELPAPRRDYGRPEFVRLCEDRHEATDAELRSQLRALGIGFDPRRWLDPMSESGHQSVKRLYFALLDAGVLMREQRLTHVCPQTQTALVTSDVLRTRLEVDRRYVIRFDVDGREVGAATFFPELLLGAVALAVDAAGPHAELAGFSTAHPLDGEPMPVVAVSALGTDATFLVPAHSQRDERICRELDGELGRPVVLDREARVTVGDFAGLSRNEARGRIVERLGDRVEVIHEDAEVEVWRSRRSRAVTVLLPTRELFVDLARAADHLRNALASGAMKVEPTHWKDQVLAWLDQLEPWCISRRQWWGHENPEDPGEVLSTWFSMVAWALQGAGWPDQGRPEPIDEVFVDPDLLVRWVIPAQLVSLALTGRVVFHTIRVHGRLHIVERSLVEVARDAEEDAKEDAREGAEDGAEEGAEDTGDAAEIDSRTDSTREGKGRRIPDEDRFVFRTVRRPMRRSTGNVVEPITLVQRFGADALRLGLLLCLGDGPRDVVTASESILRQARHAVHHLVSVLGGLRARDLESDDTPRLGDEWILSRVEELSAESRYALLRNEPEESARLFVKVTRAVGRYSRLVGERRRLGERTGPVQRVLADLTRRIADGFEPICPFVVARLGDTLVRPDAEPVKAERDWLPELVELLSTKAVRGIFAVDKDSREDLLANLGELSRLTRRKGLRVVDDLEAPIRRCGPVQLSLLEK